MSSGSEIASDARNKAAAQGQSCPVGYRYSPAVFDVPASQDAETVYVIGGLYGNAEALKTILKMQQAEQRAGRDVLLVFNGDHNWFNIDAESFQFVNDVALDNISIRGNVETEIAMPMDGGCGCNYPDYVDTDLVERSNAIMARLQRTAADFPGIRRALAVLPMTRTIAAGGQQIGIVHGDPEMLSGWAFAAERLSPIRKCLSGDEALTELTPLPDLERYFRDANVIAFASTHTCLPHARILAADGRSRAIFNNGAAGMPNFANTKFGVITRISAVPEVPANSLYGATIDGMRFDALPVPFDQPAFIRQFLHNWPPGSPAFVSYFDRIVSGPDFDLKDAMGSGISGA